MKKGTYVSRSTFQKLKEENKKLLSDIRILSEAGFPSADKILTLAKWRKKFREEREFNQMLREVVLSLPERQKT
jgi:hypothetical protein